MNQVSPEFVRIIHDEKIRKLEREIEIMRMFKERREADGDGFVGQRQAWYVQAAQWVRERIFNRAPARQPEMIEQPCPTVPC